MLDTPTLAIFASALASFVVAGLLVLTAGAHGRFTMDRPGAIQKFHSTPTPRVGGIGIYLALLAGSRFISDAETNRILTTLLIAGVPALLIGLLEDITKSVSVSVRLAATMASGLTACWVSGVSLVYLGVPGLDTLLGVAPVALLFTAFAVAGVSNAFNIIDGFHGLASGTASICLLALAAISALAGDQALALTAVVVAAAVAGFWLVNFPWGRLFLGDGGAYFAGFALAWIAVLLPIRNPTVSPWASLLVCAYPIIEVLYSIARRYLQRQSAGQADRRHLHSLVATQIVQRHFGRLNPTLQNSSVSVIMWVYAAVPAAAAIGLYRQSDLLIGSAVACMVAYHFIYRRVART